MTNLHWIGLLKLNLKCLNNSFTVTIVVSRKLCVNLVFTKRKDSKKCSNCQRRNNNWKTSAFRKWKPICGIIFKSPRFKKCGFGRFYFYFFLFSVSVLVSHNFLFFSAVQISLCGSNFRLYRTQPQGCAFVLNFKLCKWVVKYQLIRCNCCAGKPCC